MICGANGTSLLNSVKDILTEGVEMLVLFIVTKLFSKLKNDKTINAKEKDCFFQLLLWMFNSKEMLNSINPEGF